MNKPTIYIRFENQTDDELSTYDSEIVPRKGDTVVWQDARHTVIEVVFQPLSGGNAPVVVLAAPR